MYQDRVQINLQNIYLPCQRVKHLANVLVICLLVLQVNQVVDSSHYLVLYLHNLCVLQDGKLAKKMPQHFTQNLILPVP